MTHNRTISVVGLGYVGLPVAVAFGKHARTIGFDINATRIAELKTGHDRTGEVEDADLAAAQIVYTDQFDVLREADFHIVAVPTPVDDAHQPDLTPVEKASETVARALKKGDIVVYESTVYPGVTEDICVPILEKLSGLRCGEDFTVGYSPERINPGDKEHTFTKIKKVVSGQDAATLDIVAAVYASVVTAGVHKAASIKVAEAAKVIENTQRDLNIALMNEIALIFDRMGIATRDVLAAAGTKWNFLPFTPGLVGGHCIGVDPFYLTAAAEKLGYRPEVILAGRRINDSMGQAIAQKLVKLLIAGGVSPCRARVGVMGLTFKQDVPDIRNSKVPDILAELREYGIAALVSDPLADPAAALREYGITLSPPEALTQLDALVLAVSHAAYIADPADLIARVREGGVLIDVKSALDRAALPEELVYWSL